jgi:hypothetical protein
MINVHETAFDIPAASESIEAQDFTCAGVCPQVRWDRRYPQGGITPTGIY